MTAHFEALQIGKDFGGARALSGVDLTIERDTFHAFVGENGAGKSTLGRIIAGLHRPSSGRLRVAGQEVRFKGPRDALNHGITMVVQERTIVPSMSVLDNVMLNREKGIAGFVKPAAGLSRYEEICDLAGFSMDPYALVGDLRQAEQLRVEILRALARDVDLLVLDEVTAALAPDEAEAFFGLLRQLRDRHRTIVYVTHFLDEVVQFADTVTILREGRVVRTSPAAAETPATLVTGMLGRSLESVYPPKAEVPPADAPVVLDISGLSRGDEVKDVSFQVRAGEIVGLAGLVGAGRSEIARAVFGADRATAGTISVDGEVVVVRRPKNAIEKGIALIPESRQTEGLVLGRSVAENISLAHMDSLSTLGMVDPRKQKGMVEGMFERFDIRASSPDVTVGSLSGGNQQKALFAKWFVKPPRVLIADEPTRGVDIGAKNAIYQILNDLAREGAAIVLISSELEEVLNLAHRVLVIRNGSVVAECEADVSQKESVLRAAFGQSDDQSINPLTVEELV